MKMREVPKSQDLGLHDKETTGVNKTTSFAKKNDLEDITLLERLIDRVSLRGDAIAKKIAEKNVTDLTLLLMRN